MITACARPAVKHCTSTPRRNSSPQLTLGGKRGGPGRGVLLALSNHLQHVANCAAHAEDVGHAIKRQLRLQGGRQGWRLEGGGGGGSGREVAAGRTQVLLPRGRPLFGMFLRYAKPCG